MNKKRTITLLIIIVLVQCFLTINISYTSDATNPRGMDPAPVIKDSAPTKIQLQEDGAPYYLNLFDIFKYNGTKLNFTVWTGTNWDDTYENEDIKITIQSNDSLKLAPKPDMYGSTKIVVNASNNGNCTEYELSVSIAPVNDPPVIESIGNINVKGVKSVNIFMYQKDWYNASVSATDVDGDTLVFLDNTKMFDINYQTGLISFKPTQDDLGDTYVNITVSDINGTNCEASIVAKFTVLNTNDPPKAYIEYPSNGSVVYKDRNVYFNGYGEDPDVGYGDNLTFKWYSDIDGFLGDGETIYAYSLSIDEHQITLKVTDSKGLYDKETINITVKRNPYDPLYNTEIYIDNDYEPLIIKQDNKAICQAVVSNYGPETDHIYFEMEEHLNFTGELTTEFDNVTLEVHEKTICNISISVPADAKVGLYLIDIYARSTLKDKIDDDNSDDNDNSSNKKDDNYPDDDYYDKYDNGYEGYDTITVIVVSNNSNDKNKQANTPVWSEGYEWNYTTTLSNSIIGYGVFEGSMYMAISEIGKKEVNNIDYDVFVMDLEASFVMDDDSMYGIGYMDMDIQGQSYYQTSNLATVLEEMDADMTMRTYGEEMDYMVETSREFKPPLNHYEFPIKSTESWETTSTITERTHYKMSGPYGDSDTNTEVKRETASFICLGIENVTTPAGTFESYIVLEYGKETDYGYDNDYGYGNDDWEDEPKYKDDNYDDYRSSDTGTRQSIDIFGEDEAYSILYFSPEVKNVVKQVTYQQTYDYDPDTYEEISYWQEGSITELISYKVETDGGNPDPDKDNDKDNDNLPDDWEDDFEVEDPNDDTDGDGFTNKDEYETGTDPNDAEDNPDDIKDEDSDGMPDAWEVYHELDPTDPADAMENPDGDNNNNLEEYLNRKDPFESDDPPPQNNDEDSESVLGFGKIGGFDLAYIYIIIILIIITILTLFGLMVRKRKREKTVSMKKQAAIKEESRVARQEDTTASEELKEDHDDEKSRKEHRAKKDNVLTYDPRPKAPVTDSRRARRRHYPPPPPPPPPQEKTRYEKPNYYGNDYDYPPPPPPTRSRSSSDYYQDRGNDGYGNNRNEYKPYDPALDRKDDFDRYYRKRY